MDRLTGKVAVVTGAASGIGWATAIRFAEEGASVACLDVAADDAGKAAAKITEQGGRAEAYRCDVADAESVTKVVGEVLGQFGQIDVLANIAGIGKFSHSHESSLDEWNKILAVNLTGTFLMCRAVLPHLLERGSGSIINTASSAGVMGQPYSAAYCASKGGVVLLTKSLASEYVKRGIRINAVAPGGVQTPIVDKFGFPDGADMALFGKIMPPTGHMCQPEEIAAAFAYLASDETKYMTGSVLVLDGGITA
jgi:NAD(P)-dependent dehydrogenase (short-subunit alcohol dehydrogenase family)